MTIKPIKFYELIQDHAYGGKHFYFSPNTWKIRLALHHKGLSFETVELTHIEVRDELSKRCGARATVPAVEWEDESPLCDAFKIAAELDRRYPDAPPIFAGLEGQSLARVFEMGGATWTGTFEAAFMGLQATFPPGENRDYFVSDNRFGPGGVQRLMTKTKEEKREHMLKGLKPLVVVLKERPNGYFQGLGLPGYVDFCLFGRIAILVNYNQPLAKEVLRSEYPELGQWFDRIVARYPEIRAHLRDVMADDEDDYMSASILEAAQTAESKHRRQRESSMTYSEKRRKEMDEARRRGTVKNLAEREKEAREAGLKQNVLKEENKGFQLMQKLGFKRGMTLGKDPAEETPKEADRPAPTLSRLLEPIPIVMKADKRGIRALTRPEDLPPDISEDDEELDDAEREERRKRRKLPTATDFRQNVSRRLDSRRTVGELNRARRTVQSLDEGAGKPRHVLWPPEIPPEEITLDAPVAVRRKGVGGGGEEGDEGMGMAFKTRDENEEYAIAITPFNGAEEDKEEIGAIDAKQEAFEALEPDDQLRETVKYLRSEYCYCLWCGDRFKDQEELAQLCPGFWRDDHDDE
ncbi:hypothetical protein HDU96_007240 [Phlyctochytrium bullatum]|nr:hypothetical protein HDU96_007240 [Phlyctochytrium bullatum]